MARRRRRTNGITLMAGMAAMAAEASLVIPLRLMRIAAGGPAGRRESDRMVKEKIAAASRAALTLGTGGSPETVMHQLTRKVRANRRRLST